MRTGVLAFSSFLLFLSFCAVAGLVTEDTRILVGGYSLCSNWIVDVLGCFGVVFSLMGIVGVFDNHTCWVRWFANFAAVRLVLRVYILWSDFGMLEGCEKFGMSSVTSTYNAAMQMVTLHGHCSSTRTYYLTWSLLDIFFSLYGLWNAYHWCYKLDNGPLYHISIDDSKPLRIYTGYSTVGHPEAPPIVVVPPNSPGPTFAKDMGYDYGTASMGPDASTRLTPPDGGYGIVQPPVWGTNQGYGVREQPGYGPALPY